MPRRVRELADEGIYHVFSRGNNRQKIFREASDFDFYLRLFREAKLRHFFDLYHYCLMSNHVHLLLRVYTGEDLPKLMHWVQLSYSRYYKKKYASCGHLFQGRFRSPRIGEESYYLQCGRYIERNPLKAGMVEEASKYFYSSARHYCYGIKDDLITPNLYYEEMGKTPEARQAAYRKFVALDEPYEQMLDESLMKT